MNEILEKLRMARMQSERKSITENTDPATPKTEEPKTEEVKTEEVKTEEIKGPVSEAVKPKKYNRPIRVNESEDEDSFYTEIGRRIVEEIGIFECQSCHAKVSPLSGDQTKCPACNEGTLVERTKSEAGKGQSYFKTVKGKKVKARKAKKIIPQAQLNKMARGGKKGHRRAAAKLASGGVQRQRERSAAKTRAMNSSDVPHVAGKYFLVGDEVTPLGGSITEATQKLSEMLKLDVQKAEEIIVRSKTEVVEI